MFCSKCGAQVGYEEATCPKCGAPAPGKGGAANNAPEVPNHLIGAILTTVFCCLPSGIAAIIFACQVNTKLAQGDVEGAKKSSKNAKTWITVGVIVGFIVIAINVVVHVLLASAQIASQTGVR